MRSVCSRWYHSARLVGLILVVSSCTSGTDETTTSITQATTTTTTSSTTTTTTVALVSNGSPVILEGDRNEFVAAFQFLMNCSGYGELEVDGAFGPATRTAIEGVQSDLGREVTGAPDDATFATLSRGCSEDRRVTIGEEDEGERIEVGNTSSDDPESFFIRGDEGSRLTIVVVSDTGEAVVDVRAVNGGLTGPAATSAWAADLTETQDYIVEVSTEGGPTTFFATFSQVELDAGSVKAADDDTVTLDTLDETVTDVCLDTTGELSYVAETSSGFLVVTTGSVGSFARGHGGIGAPIEFVFKDDSPGYHGFLLDFDVAVADQIDGTGVVFLRGPGRSAEPFELAFSFDRSVEPCEGAAGIPIVLAPDGIGIVDFGAGADETLGFVRSALAEASPTVDTGWAAIDIGSNLYGICREATTEARVMQVDNLTLFFFDGGSSFAPTGTRHFAAFTADEGIFPFVTSGGIGAGSTVGEVLAAHPDAVAVAGPDGGVDVFISSPPGDDHWLRAHAADASGPSDLPATITSVSGGRLCDQ
jgi:hypothetical protein